MANKTITQFTSISSLADGDELLIWDVSTSLTRKITFGNFGAGYALLAGRSGGQTLRGGTASGNNLVLESTSHSTKGVVVLQPNGGNVAVGTSSAQTLLHLQSNSPTIRISDANATTDAEVAGLVEWYRGNNTQRTAYIGHPDTSTENFRVVNQTAGGHIDWYTSSTFRMRLTATGNLGIGTTIIGSKLDVAGSIRGNYDTDTTSYFGRAAVGYTGSNSDYASFAHIDYNSATEYALVQRSTGVTVVNSIAGQATRLAAGGVSLYAADTAAFYPFTDDTYDLGKIANRFDDVYATNGTIQTSDRGDKEQIGDSDLGLAFIKQLRPRRYKWQSTEEKPNRRPHYGLIAQEVKEALDELEVEDFGGYIHDADADAYGLRYHEFIGPLVKAVQELAAENERLSSQLESLTRRP